MTVDGTPVSDTDLARIHAEEELHEQWARRTVRVVASAARDADDCRMLLDILGLSNDVVLAARTEHTTPEPVAAAAPTSRSTRKRRPHAA